MSHGCFLKQILGVIVYAEFNIANSAVTSTETATFNMIYF